MDSLRPPIEGKQTETPHGQGPAAEVESLTEGKSIAPTTIDPVGPSHLPLTGRRVNWRQLLADTKIAVEIVAICVAGYWTYDRFIRVERDSAGARSDPSIQVESKKLGALCSVDIEIRLKNIGTQDMPEPPVHLVVYSVAPGSLAPPVMISGADLMRHGHKVVDRQIHMGVVPVGVRNTSGLTWLLKPESDSYYFFMATLTTGKERREEGVWQRLCE